MILKQRFAVVTINVHCVLLSDNVLPVSVWQGSKEIGDDGRIKMEINDGEILLLCKAAQKDDQGRYSATLKNPKGSDTVHINVTVLDKPGAPEGPLAVSKITPDSCTLEWKPPKVL